MKINSNDRRVRKTRKSLRESLAQLLMEKELHQITVRELTELADIHRATFYTHYQDIFELYEKTEEAVLNEIVLIIENSPKHNYKSLFTLLLDYVLDNKLLFQMLLGDTGNRRFQNKVCHLLEEQYLKISKHESSLTAHPIEWEYLTSYHIQGCLTLLSKWLKEDYQNPSKEQFINMILRIDEIFDEILDSYQ